VTPLLPCGGVDTQSLACQIRHALAGGVKGLLLLGTYGEGHLLTAEERGQAIATAVDTARGRVPIIVGIHTASIEEAIAQAEQAKNLGAAAVLVKYLGNPTASPHEVYAYYAALCDSQVLPVFYYHYPDHTGLRMSASDVARILSLPGVVGIKESILNLREMQAHIDLAKAHDKAFFCSTALILTQYLQSGGNGAMCPEAVLLPGPTVQCFEAFVNGRAEEARAIQSELFVLTPVFRDRMSVPHATRIALTAAANHHLPLPMATDKPQARIKAALTSVCVPTPTVVKCPLPALTAHELARVQTAMRRAKLIDWTLVGSSVPPVPHVYDCRRGGMILKSGAFMLGPNVGKDLLGSQGDGKAGFFD
jgi:4-hydroxy-tetrahydrodipicolinate synthase